MRGYPARLVAADQSLISANKVRFHEKKREMDGVFGILCIDDAARKSASSARNHLIPTNESRSRPVDL